MDPLNDEQAARRRWLALMSLCFCGPGCTTGTVDSEAGGVDQQRRFRGIGLVLVVDAVPGVEMAGVVFEDDKGATVYAKSVLSRRTREIMAFGSTRVPLFVRVLWRDHPKPVWGRQGSIDYEGPIIGDHTVPVAARIPDAVLRDIRAKPGSLRLKFRLKPDGVLFGWDIERDGGGVSRFDSPGGDFLETRY
ncbi:hypothetical protein [Hydrogenophaga crocea]|uniref:Uncharacterized protein n=1 Tax=Hydrogenophaga crocea TaxID=2716225 RepID=A0A6G8ID52_9BURK|nr:hypothetical protein [Hydrogenophaga crocea]QIM51082.1 hypothetical protein G9Q37_02495 [Hydrogenophaga crocea]